MKKERSQQEELDNVIELIRATNVTRSIYLSPLIKDDLNKKNSIAIIKKDSSYVLWDDQLARIYNPFNHIEIGVKSLSKIKKTISNGMRFLFFH